MNFHINDMGNAAEHFLLGTYHINSKSLLFVTGNVLVPQQYYSHLIQRKLVLQEGIEEKDLAKN